MTRKPRTSKDYTHTCGHCALCSHTYLGCVCTLSDNAVDYGQDGCIDFISEEDDDFARQNI